MFKLIRTLFKFNCSLIRATGKFFSSLADDFGSDSFIGNAANKMLDYVDMIWEFNDLTNRILVDIVWYTRAYLLIFYYEYYSKKAFIVSAVFLVGSVVIGLITPFTADIGIGLDLADKVVEGLVTPPSPQEDLGQLAKECGEYKPQDSLDKVKPLKQESPAATTREIVVFCVSIGVFLAVRFFAG
jgi:hypothetical protein